jgi:phospholipase/carboxylesterase
MTHRRQLFPLIQQPPIESTFEIQAGLCSTAVHDTVHAIFAPMDYTRRYPYPLIVWLHGPGNDERQLTRIMPLVSMKNYMAVAPRGVLMKKPGGRREIYGWPHTDDAVVQAEQVVFDSIDVAGRRFSINSGRVFLAGFDSGGTMAFRVAMNHPDRFCGVLSLGGAFPTGHTPLARLPETRRLPIFIASGRRSSVYGEADVCDDLRLLHTAGLSTTLRSYPCGQELAPQMLADMNRWIMDQIPSACTAVGALR